MKKYKITVKSNMPMLHHAMTETAKANLRVKGSQKVNQNRTARQIAEEHVYRNNGHAGVPVRNVIACLISAGKFHFYKGKSKLSTRNGTMVTMFCRYLGEPDDVLIMTSHDGEPITWDAFEVDSSQGVNPTTNSAVMIDRPKFKEWGLVLEMEVDEKEIDDNKFRALWGTAGQIGLGAWRTERRGCFGTFDVEVNSVK